MSPHHPFPSFPLPLFTPFTLSPLLFLAPLLLLPLSPLLSRPPDPLAFLDSYCLRCHDEEVQKGDRRFDEILFPITDLHGLIEVQEMIDQLTLGEMPPRKAKEQPTEEERIAMIEALTTHATRAAEALQGDGGQTVLRRLNEREYTNSLGDLLGRELRTLGVTAKFPRDQMAEHMDNLGDTLHTSAFLLDRYLEAADLVVEKALGMEKEPEVKTWRFKGNFHQGQELSFSHKRVYNYRYLCVYEVPNTVNHEGGYAYIHDFAKGVHADGIYEVKALAHAQNRKHPYDRVIFQMDPEEPFRLGIVSGDYTAGTLHHPQPVEPQLAEVTVGDGEPEWHTMRVWLEKGQTPRFIFPNGMANCRQAFSKINRQYQRHWPEHDRGKMGIVDSRRIVLEHGKMPHIRIHDIAIRGPLYEEWPPPSQQLVFGEKGYQKEETRTVLRRFADRAYRRPATDEEIDRLLELVAERTAAGHTHRQAVLDALKATLCSPAFLYLAEPGEEAKDRALGPHDLAARLSYFLWATLPDERLRALADSGKILQPQVLEAELERLLESPRSEAFERGFLDSWLNLRALGDMPPDRSTFSTYYAKDLQSAMRRETRLFLRNLIRENAPLTDLLDSDYTFANKPLAQLYQLPAKFAPERAHEFRRVSLPDRRRGGLLGMGSVLTVTANGIETSPVTRGVWILETLLGNPPPPPPDDVPPIDPDIRGATSIRDQLVKHREISTCASCHEKIDPPGFALESFDPIGRWRSHYLAGKRKGPRIDPSGTLSGGGEFADVAGFKTVLLERKKVFAHALTDRLLSYAIGRRVGALDRPAVDAIVDEVVSEDYGMRTLLREIIRSKTFRSR